MAASTIQGWLLQILIKILRHPAGNAGLVVRVSALCELLTAFKDPKPNDPPMRKPQIAPFVCFVVLCLSPSVAWAGFVNLALESAGGVATQSSTRVGSGGNEARFAIDGNTNGSFGAGSVTHTQDQPNSFWEVQLPESSNLAEVVLFNRSDCCGIRLSNFRLSAFDGSTEVFGDDFFVGSGSVAQGGDFHVPLPFGTTGDRVRLELLGNNNEGNGIISLAEAQVFGGDVTNLARAPGAVATQSSTRVGSGGNEASFAIDGNTDGNFSDGSVTHTLDMPDSFWELQLPELSVLEEIVLFNRADCCGIRLSNFRVSAFDGSVEVFGEDFFVGSGSVAQGGQLQILLPSDVQADRLRVQLLGNNNEGNGVLSLAEVQVFGRNATVIPEPTTLAIWSVVGLGACVAGRRRR